MTSRANQSDLFIPEALKTVNNWCLWRLEQRKNDMTKVPYQVSGTRASSTDRNTWNSFDAVSEILAIDTKYKGLGFFVSDDFVFIDCDHCITDGIMDKRGADILSAFPLSYTEISQSGTGLHVITKGILQRSFHNQKQGIEAYSTARFCAMTGNAIQRNEPTLEQDGINYVFNKYGTHSRKKNVFNSANTISQYTDRQVIAHASNVTGSKGRDFHTLFFQGDISAYGSPSEADQALCVLLAFWTDRDSNQIDRLFRTSALYRAKWEREDYRNRTITHACEHIPESISEYQKRMYREKARAIAEQRD